MDFLEKELWNNLTTNEESVDLIQFEWNIDTILKSTVFCGIIVSTLIGNALVLLSILLNHSLRSPTHFFIGNLAASDFLVGLLVLPCNATTQIMKGRWYFGSIYCIAWHCIHLWLCSTSILSILAVCFDRFIGVSRPLKHFKLMRGNTIRLIVCVVWILAFILGVIPVFIFPEPQSENPWECRINEQFGLVMVVTVGIFYIPMALMIIFYWRIYVRASKYFRSIRNGELKSTNSDDGLRIHVGGSGSDAGLGQMGKFPSSSSTEILLTVNLSRQTKTAKRLTIVVGAFIFCYFPFFTLFLLRSLVPGLISDELFNVFGWLRYFNSCLNPVIYSATMPAFREAIRHILCYKR